MTTTALLDLAPITRHLRAKASSYLLTAAVHHIPVFEALSKGPRTVAELQQTLGLKDRPASVLFPALCAMQLLVWKEKDVLELTELGTYLTTACPLNLTGYTGLEQHDPGVVQMAQCLLNDGQEEKSKGLSYVKDEDAPSPMDNPEEALFFTMALAGRARNLAPIVAQKIPRQGRHLLDVAGGTGYYTFEWLLANPTSTATLLDRPEVLKVAQKLLDEFCSSSSNAGNIQERITFMPGDMLKDELPAADVLFAFSLFHDWDTDTCRLLTNKFAGALKPGGLLWIHDAFLNDTLDGPLAVTDYSALLFLHTKGRCYSAQEYREFLSGAGLITNNEVAPTSMDYGLLSAQKPG